MCILERKNSIIVSFLIASSIFFSFKRKPVTKAYPNILWITCKDINPMPDCYDDVVAHTPNLDQLAKQGQRYTNAYATAPVCSPSRSCIITGVHATSLGSQHLRSEVNIPEKIVPFPKLLRKHGLYCTNNDKEYYNFTDTTIWNESGKKDQPFFNVFNLEMTHQSQIFGTDRQFENKYGHLLSMEERCQLEDISLPPYYPCSILKFPTTSRVHLLLIKIKLIHAGMFLPHLTGWMNVLNSPGP